MERLFPTLTTAQIARVAARGRRRTIARGEVLVEAGDKEVPFFVVVSGELQALRPSGATEILIVAHGPGQFTGEATMITGRRAMGRLRASEPGEVIQLERQQLLALIQTDAELSEILMRAFMLRRLELIAHELGDAVMIGSAHCAGTLRVKEFLTRNGHPFHYIDLDRDAEAQAVLDQFHVSAADVPVLICGGDAVLRNPSNAQIAECLGFNDAIDGTRVSDLVIVGAGPAGLAAAVYGASEGLDVLVVESGSPGGQAGSSSRIENYLGFPTGISGQELAGRALAQAQKFGANMMIARTAVRLECDRRPYQVILDEGTPLPTRSIVLAAGAQYNKPPIPKLSQFEGNGVYYGATAMESQLCVGEDVVVVGGGNSAGQAAVYLSGKARKVHMLVRSGKLADTMSRYLIWRIEGNAAIELHYNTEIASVDGDGHLECISWRDGDSGQIVPNDIRHLFVMTGASPRTGWLEGCLALDNKGFVLTGHDLDRATLEQKAWPLSRPPQLLETSLPGVFAVGDIRAGNVKRVASAVGEGSIAIHLVHQVLAEM